MEEDKQIITERYFEAINICNIELFGRIKEEQDKIKPLYPIIAFIVDRLCTVTNLTIQNSVWDAEIVYRCALETFMKYIFITSADEQEQTIRLKEFWDDLAEIKLIKLCEQAKKKLHIFGDSEISRLAYSPLLLPEQEEAILKTKWPKVKRQQLEQKWSFTEIVISLAKNYRGNPLESFLGFTHPYRMASHVSHGDETGILIIQERQSRPSEERDIADFAHYLRLLSDSFMFTSWTAIEAVRFLKQDSKYFFDLQKSLADIQILIEKYHLKVFDDPLYNKYRSQ